ncbi:MAG: hypothetical protein U9N09_09915 [Euryarchaeota archaeon]|nr:hypothetical protein [Euryarchaeota archaeon]
MLTHHCVTEKVAARYKLLRDGKVTSLDALMLLQAAADGIEI